MPNLFSVAQAAPRLGISDSLLRRYCREGRIGEKVSKSWIITEKEIKDYQPPKIGRPKGPTPQPGASVRAESD